MRRDIVSAYIASTARVASWVVVSALVYRFISPAALAMLALVRATIGILNYTSVGLAPAMIRLMALAKPQAVPPPAGPGGTLDYERPPPPDLSLESIYSNGLTLAFLGYLVGSFIVFGYVIFFPRLHDVPAELPNLSNFVLLMGAGTLLRLLGESAGAVLQVRSRIFHDNLLQAAAELVWLILTLMLCLAGQANLNGVALAYAASAAALTGARAAMAKQQTGVRFAPRTPDWRIVRHLLSYGGLIMVAQLADFLYAPVDYILINRLIDAVAVAAYTPAVQIDAGLLLLVSGMAAVLLPKAALAHGAGDVSAVRRYYLRGTLASAALLTLAGLIVWLVAPWLFTVWFGDKMQTTQAILPLVLIHTIVGGSSAVGRSILLGMGRVKPFTIAVLIAGATNVLLSYVFVRYFELGLRGIVLGTIVVVVVRCAVWMPWYVWRTLRRSELMLEARPSIAVSQGVVG